MAARDPRGGHPALGVAHPVPPHPHPRPAGGGLAGGERPPAQQTTRTREPPADFHPNWATRERREQDCSSRMQVSCSESGSEPTGRTAVKDRQYMPEVLWVKPPVVASERHAQPRSCPATAVAVQNRIPIGSCASHGCGHTTQVTLTSGSVAIGVTSVAIGMSPSTQLLSRRRRLGRYPSLLRSP